MRTTQVRRSNISLIVKMLKLVAPLKVMMIRAIFSGILGNLCAIFLVTVAAVALTNWIESGYFSTRYLYALGVFGIMRGVLRYVEQYNNHDLAFRILALIRDKVYSRLRILAPAKLEERSSGDLISLITTDVELLEVFYAHTISPVAIAMGASTVMVIFVGSYHFIFGLILLVSFLFVGVIIPIINEKNGRKTGGEYRSLMGSLSAFILDSIRGRRQILQFQSSSYMLDKLRGIGSRLAREKSIARNHESITGMSSDVVIYGQLLLSIFVGSKMISSGVSAGSVIIPIVTMMSSFGPVLALSALSNNLMQTLASADRVMGLLEESPVVEEKYDGEVIDEFEELSFNNVDFSYKDVPVIKNSNFAVKKGDKIGISGESGCGKSTLLKLMMRFWDPVKGDINMNDKNLKDISTVNLRGQYSYMTQSTHLFMGTIGENLRLANPMASNEEVIEAAKKASIHDQIMGFSNGYDTPVAQWGESLSAGERQRIALARVLLHKTPMMLLDEPTANIDSLNEGMILSALEEESKGRGMILVSHKPSTLSIVDRVWDAKKGELQL
ncbi:MAG: ATP-binding cassette domain-containing protein [Tissierellia bacterium]|nr:ATP-binding cassette domain-containing protein [Tissierellia bacterium]